MGCLKYRSRLPAADARDPWELADRIRLSFGGRRFTDSAALIRKDRDR